MGRVFRVSLRESTWMPGDEERNTNIVIYSDTYDQASGRTVTFKELSNVKKVKVGDAMVINSGNANTSRFFNINGAWESVHDWLIITQNGVASDPVLGGAGNTIGDGYRTIAPNKDSMYFNEIIPSTIENAKYAIGKWAWQQNYSWIYDKYAGSLGGLDARNKYSDISSAMTAGRRLGVVGYKRADIAHSESHNDLNLLQITSLGAFSTANQVKDADIESWFRETNKDDFQPMSEYFAFINESTNRVWYTVYNPTDVRFVVSPEFDLNPHPQNWSRMSQTSQWQNEAPGAWRDSIIKTNMTRAQFVTMTGNNNMWYFVDKVPDDELTEVKYQPAREDKIFSNQTWWDIQVGAINKSTYYNFKSADFLRGTMTLGRQVRGQLN